MNKYNNTIQQGFSIVELLVAIAVVALVFVAIMSAVTYSLRNSRFSKEKAVSIRLAQESIEWTRRQRSDLGWSFLFDVLSNDAGGDNEVTYCVNALPEDRTEFVALTQLDSVSNCPTISSDTVEYTRTVTFTLDNDPNSKGIAIVSTVTWDDGSLETTLRSELREWK